MPRNIRPSSLTGLSQPFSEEDQAGICLNVGPSIVTYLAFIPQPLWTRDLARTQQLTRELRNSRGPASGSAEGLSKAEFHEEKQPLPFLGTACNLTSTATSGKPLPFAGASGLSEVRDAAMIDSVRETIVDQSHLQAPRGQTGQSPG